MPCLLLQYHKEKLKLNTAKKRNALLHPKSTSTMKGVSVAFKDSLRIVLIGDDEFYTVIDAPFAKERSGGKLGQFAICVMLLHGS